MPFPATYQYPSFGPFNFISWQVSGKCAQYCPIMNYFAFGKMPESPVITFGANSTTQVVIPSSKNKYLESVIVTPEMKVNAATNTAA